MRRVAKGVQARRMRPGEHRQPLHALGGIRRMRAVLVALVLAGCVSEPAAISDADAATASGASGRSVQEFEGTLTVGAGFESPVFSGCEGTTYTFQASDRQHAAALPVDATQLRVDLTGTATPPARLRLCVFGLDAGTQSVVGVPPLLIEAPLASEEEASIVVLPGNDQPGVVGTVEYAVVATTT